MKEEAMDNNNHSPNNNTDVDDLFLNIARARHENAVHNRSEEAATRQIPLVRGGVGKSETSAGRRTASSGAHQAAARGRSARAPAPGSTARRNAVSYERAQSSAVGNPAMPGNTQSNAQSRNPSGDATRSIPRVERRKPVAGTSGGAIREGIGGTVGAENRQAASAAARGPAQRSPASSGARGRGSTCRRKNKESGGTALPSLVKAMIYIVTVFVVGGVLGYYGVVIGNDVFALVKSTDEISVTIPDGLTTAELGDVLEEAGVIRFPGIFSFYGDLRHDTKPYIAGEYVVSPSMNFDQLRRAFHEKTPEATIISITIPEGMTTDEIIDLFIENGIGTREKFVDAIQNYDFEGYWFLDELEVKEGRRYRLDGYLYPDTYYFYTTSSEVSVIYKLLDRFDEIFPDAYREALTERGFTADQIVTLASMVQKEAKYESEFGWISSVFNNRLSHPGYETQGYLNSDATTLYGLDDDKGFVTGEDNEKDGPYNTYTRKGLPVGPIANPSYSAITWALYPAETDYYYFVAKKDGYNLFAKTAAEHAQNKIAALSDQ